MVVVHIRGTCEPIDRPHLSAELNWMSHSSSSLRTVLFISARIVRPILSNCTFAALSLLRPTSTTTCINSARAKQERFVSAYD